MMHTIGTRVTHIDTMGTRVTYTHTMDTIQCPTLPHHPRSGSRSTTSSDSGPGPSGRRWTPPRSMRPGPLLGPFHRRVGVSRVRKDVHERQRTVYTVVRRIKSRLPDRLVDGSLSVLSEVSGSLPVRVLIRTPSGRPLPATGPGCGAVSVLT